MYAIFEDGSRQYRAEPGTSVVIDYRDVDLGTTLELTKILLYQNGAETLVGQPLVEGARIVGQVTEYVTKKTMTQKFRRRKASKRLRGHTQPHLRVKIQHILKAGGSRPSRDSINNVRADARRSPNAANSRDRLIGLLQ